MIIDSETEALVKCTELMKDLHANSKVRVLKYLIDRFNLTPPSQQTTLPLEKIVMPPTVIEDNSNEDSNKKDGEVNGSVTKNKTSKSRNPKTFSIVKTLNLNPQTEKSLKDFYAEYNPKLFYEQNLLFIYYLEKILKETAITLDHVYSCYKHLSLKVPGVLIQSLRDTGRDRGWLNTEDINSLKVTIPGENYVEHDMEKAISNDRNG